jgi:PAS domain S-box-containing protein
VVIALRDDATTTPVESNGTSPHPDDILLDVPNDEPIPDQPCWLPEMSRNGHTALVARALPPGCSAYAQLPLLLPDGTPFGYLAAFDAARGAWSDDDRECLQVIAALICSLVAGGRAGTAHGARGPRQTQQLRALAATARAITAAPDLDAVLDIVTEHARLIIAAHMSTTSLTLNEQWSQAITSVSLSDLYAPWHSFAAQPTGHGIYSLVCETNRPLRLTQTELVAHPAWRGFGDAAGHHPPLRGLLAVPLIGREGNYLGVIQVSDKEAGEFTEDDEAILVQLAQLASGAIEQAHLYQLARQELRERRRVEAELREGEATFRHLFHHSPQPMWVVNTQTLAFLEVNDAALAQYGYSREEFMALRATDLRHPDEVPRLLAAFASDPPDGRAGGDIWRHRTRDGRLLDVVIYFHTITFAGQPARLTIAIDVTGQRQAEARLREDAARLAALVATQQAVATADPDVPSLMALIAEQTQLLTGADGAAVELVEGKFLARHAASGMLRDHPGIRFALRSSLSGLCVRLGEVLRSDDTIADPRVDQDAVGLTNAHAIIVAPLQYDGQTFGTLKAVARTPGAFGERDVSTLQLLAGLAAAVLGRAAAFVARQSLSDERSEALDALQESEERFRQLAEHINSAFWIADGDGPQATLRYISPAFAQIWGRSAAELLERPQLFFETIHPDDLAFLSEQGVN